MRSNTNLAPHDVLPGDYRRPARGTVARPAIVSIRRAGPTDTPKVRLEDVSLEYQSDTGSGLLALDRINLQVQPGEFLCIVGPSGCGKSTLLHLIAGFAETDRRHDRHRRQTGFDTRDGSHSDLPGTRSLSLAHGRTKR